LTLVGVGELSPEPADSDRTAVTNMMQHMATLTR
jgi:hypothetical protein